MKQLRFGKLVVIEYHGNNKRQEKLWRCICDCGNEKLVKTQNLRRGLTKSCGCISTGPKPEEVIGQKFNRFTVLKRVGKTPDRNQILECLCECGNVKNVSLAALRSGGAKSCGCFIREIMSAKKAELGTNYNPNLTEKERIEGRTANEHNEWAKKVKENANFCCEVCGKSPSNQLVAHHLDGYHWAKDKRCDPSNGACLCETCHRTFHKTFGFKNNTKEQFQHFLNETQEISRSRP